MAEKSLSDHFVEQLDEWVDNPPLNMPDVMARAVAVRRYEREQASEQTSPDDAKPTITSEE